MSRRDGTGPAGSGPRDGSGKKVGGKGKSSTQKVKEPRVVAKKADVSKKLGDMKIQ